MSVLSCKENIAKFIELADDSELKRFLKRMRILKDLIDENC